MTLRKQDSRKKSFIRKMFAMGERNGKKEFKGSFQSTGSTDSLMAPGQEVQSFRVFVATWNVGGKSPHTNLNLNDFLKNDNSADIYIFGFQEIVPLNAGNVLVIEDNEPAARWLSLINQSLNNPTNGCLRGQKPNTGLGGSKFFPKPSLKSISKTFRTVSRRKLKSCNCTPLELERKRSKDFWFRCQPSNVSQSGISSEEDDDEEDPSVFDISDISIPESGNETKYGLIASKQMVGIFVTIWMRKELVPHVSHLRIASTSRGIMGCLGNKGCISVSMLFHQTSFCFICSHLASGEKEGDELRRNLDVIEILKNTQFPKICRRMPEKILGHERIIWLGDLNYRIALSYSETRRLMEENRWDALLNNDQLKIERDAGRVFCGWKEGKIYFAPTYKYYYNSDTYAGDLKKSKKNRRTPAWCDRILWHGDGIRQLFYIRGESRFSDHRPVCSTFLVDVIVVDGGLKKKMPSSDMKVGAEELLPTNRRYYS